MNYLVKIFSKKKFDFFRKLLLHFSLKISGYKNFGNFFETGENLIFKLIKTHKVKNCLDIGAHTGTFSKKLLAIKNTKVIAFEPMKHSYLKLKKIEFGNRKNFRCFNIALSNEKKISEIYYTNSQSQLASVNFNLNKINFLRKKKIKKQKIKTETLDSFEAKNKNLFLKKIDYIKIDTEGHDYKVLLGAKKFIKKHKPKFIQFEMNYHYLFSGENLYQFTVLLKNYNLFQIMPYNNGLHKIDASRPENNIFHLSNFIFIKK